MGIPIRIQCKERDCGLMTEGDIELEACEQGWQMLGIPVALSRAHHNNSHPGHDEYEVQHLDFGSIYEAVVNTSVAIIRR